MAKAARRARTAQAVPAFGVELARARQRAGLSRTALQELTGISRPSLIGYEAGRNLPGTAQLHALCIALRVSPNRLLFGTERPFRRRRPGAKPKTR